MRRLRLPLDILMSILLPLQMLYLIIGEAYHEYFGTILFLLFVIHNFINWRWYKGLFKGKYSLKRIYMSLVNILCLILMLLCFISGIMMSNYAFSSLGISTGIGFARSCHMIASFWGFLMLSVHMGNHIGRFIFKSKYTFSSFSALAIFGIYFFFDEGIWRYLFLIDNFVFFDFSSPVYLLVFKYVAIMMMFAYLGAIIRKN